MPSNGSRVTPKQHYEDLSALSKAFGEALSSSEERLGIKIDRASEAISANRTANAADAASLQAGLTALGGRLDAKGGILDRLSNLDGPDGAIEGLKRSERRWGAAGAILGPIAGAVVGFLTGRAR